MSRTKTPSNRSRNFEKLREPPQKKVTGSLWSATRARTRRRPRCGASATGTSSVGSPGFRVPLIGQVGVTVDGVDSRGGAAPCRPTSCRCRRRPRSGSSASPPLDSIRPTCTVQGHPRGQTSGGKSRGLGCDRVWCRYPGTVGTRRAGRTRGVAALDAKGTEAHSTAAGGVVLPMSSRFAD